MGTMERNGSRSSVAEADGNTLLRQMEPWIATMRSSYEMSMSTWNTLLEQSEEAFMKLFKNSPMHSDALDEQIRAMWQAVKSTHRTQQELVKEHLKQMEALLKEREEKF